MRKGDNWKEFCQAGHPFATNRIIGQKGYSRGCRECGRIKRRAEYAKNRDKYIAQYRANPEPHRARALKSWRSQGATKMSLERRKRWQEQNPNYNHNWRLASVFGLTGEDYAKMLKKQKGTCAICDQVNKSGKRLAVDHDHASGQIRGLLCTNCNSIVGKVYDSQAFVDRLIKYLRVHSQLKLPAEFQPEV